MIFPFPHHNHLYNPASVVSWRTGGPGPQTTPRDYFLKLTRWLGWPWIWERRIWAASAWRVPGKAWMTFSRQASAWCGWPFLSQVSASDRYNKLSRSLRESQAWRIHSGLFLMPAASWAASPASGRSG